MIPVTELDDDLKGRSATNNAFRIIINPTVPCAAAIWAQELYEAQYKRNPINAVRIRLSKSAQRDMEIRSHEIEVCAAFRFYGQPRVSYRRAEAQRMKSGYGGLFDRYTLDELIRKMEAHSVRANNFVTDNHDDIRAMKMRIDSWLKNR